MKHNTAALMGMGMQIFCKGRHRTSGIKWLAVMRLLGAKVNGYPGTATLKDAVSETMRVDNRISDTHYVLGSVMGPHPFLTIVRDFSGSDLQRNQRADP